MALNKDRRKVEWVLPKVEQDESDQSQKDKQSKAKKPKSLPRTGATAGEEEIAEELVNLPKIIVHR